MITSQRRSKIALSSAKLNSADGEAKNSFAGYDVSFAGAKLLLPLAGEARATPQGSASKLGLAQIGRKIRGKDERSLITGTKGNRSHGSLR